jgi:hypothetical protein
MNKLQYQIEKVNQNVEKVILFTQNNVPFMNLLYNKDGRLVGSLSMNDHDAHAKAYTDALKRSSTFLTMSISKESLICHLEQLKYQNKLGYNELKTVFKKKVSRKAIEPYLGRDVLFYEGSNPKYFPKPELENPIAYYILSDKLIYVYKNEKDEVAINAVDYSVSEHVKFISSQI